MCQPFQSEVICETCKAKMKQSLYHYGCSFPPHPTNEVPGSAITTGAINPASRHHFHGYLDTEQRNQLADVDGSDYGVSQTWHPQWASRDAASKTEKEAVVS